MTSTLTAIKERPILFSGAMVKAILEGRKTQTRRVMKQQPVIHKLLPNEFNQSEAWGYKLKNGSYQDVECDGLGRVRAECPCGKPGDRLWVRETWGTQGYLNLDAIVGDPNAVTTKYIYKADGTKTYSGWKPSIHMPRKASRILLEVVNVRVERLQDISEEDAIAEGAKHYSGLPSIHPWGNDPRWSMEDSPISTDHCLNSAKLAFANYWEKLNADRGYGWDINPWVWVVEFKRVEGDRHVAD